MRPVDDLAAHLLRRGGRLRMKARGGSMMPFLWDGDIVLVAPTGGGRESVLVTSCVTRRRRGDSSCTE
jgi:hypothetical protein